MSGTTIPEEINDCVKRFAASQKAFMRSERRSALRSLLFDLPRRSSLGWHCFYEKAAQLLARLPGNVSPEEIGRRMKQLASRPNYLQLSILMCSYLGARQQRLLDAAVEFGAPWPEERVEEACFVVDFWRRVACAYRNDGRALPAEGADTEPILAREVIAALAGQLRETSPEGQRRLRRLWATLELYAFLLHGEQRDGMFVHGPYPQEDGTEIIVREFNDLQNDFLPWAQTQARNPYPNLALVLKLEGVRSRFDMFGGVLFDPVEVSPCIRAQALLTRDEATGDVHPLELGEIEAIQNAAAEAQNEIFQAATGWTPRTKIEYGIDLFANHLRTFFHAAGVGSAMDAEIRREFHAAGADLLERLLVSDEPPSVWRFLTTTEGEYFWPLTLSGRTDFLASRHSMSEHQR